MHTSIDKAIQTLQAHKKEWAELAVAEYLTLIDQVFQAIADCADEWAGLDIQNRGISPEHWDALTSYMVAPIIALRMTHSYRQSLRDICRYGSPRVPGPVTKMDNGQISVGVFPGNLSDKIMFRGFRSSVWVDSPLALAGRYHGESFSPAVSLILSAGNVASTTVGDVLMKLFTERHVVMIKPHPILKYTGYIYQKIFKPLIERGFVQIVEGGIPETEYLVQHAGIDDVHMTGSNHTFDVLLYGAGEQGKINKAQRKPILNKKLTGELGNISPLIVVPGDWSERDLQYQAENIAASIIPYGGFYCLTTRLVILHANWQLRAALLDKLRDVLRATPVSVAHYSGAHERLKKVLALHPEAEQYGEFTDKKTPWVLVANLDADNTNEVCFTTEVFGSFSSTTNIAAASIPEYIDKAVEFCNQRLWGTLAATIVVHPSSLKDENIRLAVERAQRNLRYGTISINHPPYVSYLMATNIWGAYPGAPEHDIQSGNVQVNNAYMLENTQKTVTVGPFKVTPKPAWLPGNKKARRIIKRLLAYEIDRSPLNLLRMLFASLF